MKRTPTKQSTHNQKVKEVATKLTRQGWNVKAAVPGYNRPSPIGKAGKIPDIEATKRGRRKLIEVETPDSLGRDKTQQTTFRRHAGQKPNTTFDIVVTD